MLRTLIEKEVRDIIGATKFAVIFGACAALIILSFYVGANGFLTARSQYEAAKAENLRQFEGMTDWFNVQGHRVFLPPQPVAALVSGVSNDIGRMTEISGRGELAPQDSRYNDEPLQAIFRALDLEFLFQIVLSLFAILLGYDAISGERERGTLKLAFANSLPRHSYIFGKLFGALAALGLPLLLAIAIGCLILPLLGVPMTGEDWVRLGLIIGTGFLYFGAFLTLAIMVSALTRSSSNSFMILLTVWIACVLIVPRTAVLLAGRAVDVPSVDEVGAQKMRFQSQLWQEEREHWKDFKPSNDENPEAAIEELNRFMQAAADERDAKLKELADRLNEERANAQAAQQRVAFGLARISPAASLSLGIMNLAGTSIDLKSHYKSEAQSYQAGYANFIKDKTGLVPGGRMMVFRSRIEGEGEPAKIDIKEMPEFSYHPQSLSAGIASAAFDIGLLAVFNLLFFAGAFIAFRRYDLR